MSKKHHPKKHHPKDEHVEHPSYRKEHEDDVIVVPKGGSPLRFYLTMGLVLFVLLIFMVTGPMMRALTGSAGGERIWMRWTHPSKGRVEYTDTDFIIRKRSLNSYRRILGSQQSPEDKEVAFWIILDELARDAGVRVTDMEMARQLSAFIPDVDQYPQIMRSFGTTVREFEDCLRTELRVARYRTFLVSGGSTPDLDSVERRWKAAHQEYSFDYVELEATSLAEEVRSQMGAEEVRAWFDSLLDQQKVQYENPEQYKAELLYLPLPLEYADAEAMKGAHAKLFEDYPRPESEVPEDLARQYYDSVFFQRFRRKERREVTDTTDQAQVMEAFYETFDEAQERCLIEAPLYYAIVDWHKGLVERETNAEEIDFPGEAEAYGLTYANDGELRDRAAWTELEGYGGSEVAAGLARGEPGAIAPRVVIDSGRMALTRVIEKVEPVLPPFEEIRERLEDAFVTERTQALAFEKLQALRESMLAEGQTIIELDKEVFSQKVEAAGYSVAHRDWDERATFSSDPIDQFLRGQENAYSLREDEVGEAGQTRNKLHALLVRQAGIRDPQLEKLVPADFETVRQELRTEAVEEFNRKNIDSPRYFEERYGLELPFLVEETPEES